MTGIVMDKASGLPAWVWIVGTGLILLAMPVAGFGWGRRYERRRKTAPTTGGHSFATHRLEDRLTFLAATVVSLICAQGMARFQLDKLDFTLPFVIAFGGVLELTTIICALRARRALHTTGAAGTDGLIVWAVAALSGTFSALDADSSAAGLFRLAMAALAALLWERGLAIERRIRRFRRTSEARARPNAARRILIRLGLLDGCNETEIDIATAPRITRIAVATARFQAAQSKRWRRRQALRRAEARLQRALLQALRHTDLAHNSDLQKRLDSETAVLTQARGFAHRRHHPYWSPAPPGTESRPRICLGATAPPGLVPLRLRGPGRSLRILHPAPRGQASASARRLGRPETPGNAHAHTSPKSIGQASPTSGSRGPTRTAVPSGYSLQSSLSPYGPHNGRTSPYTPLTPLTTSVRTRNRQGAWTRQGSNIRVLSVQALQPSSPGSRAARRTADADSTPAHPPRTPVQPPRDQARFVTGDTTSPTYATADKPALLTTGQRRNRSYWIQVLADEIRTAVADNRIWEPDYRFLMDRTRYSRSWCEKVVHDARELAALIGPLPSLHLIPPARTAHAPYGPSSSSRGQVIEDKGVQRRPSGPSGRPW
ncbi:hypothetical protein [Spirillospora sp. CA-128828]|uniref:hypothetical protein n=1 Tax=Spirillospora sp. CA-128828 TaxID=3240033 RepID=UPI003D93D628